MRTQVFTALALASTLVLAQRSLTQSPIDVLRKSPFPGRVSSVHTHVTGDFDGDGDVDIIYTTGENGSHEILLNDGHGRFSRAAVALPQRGFYAALTAGDIDGDGDLDLVSAHMPFPTLDSGQTRLFLNDGKAQFRESKALPKDSDWSTDLLLVDVDGRNGLDIVVGNTKSKTNTGSTVGQTRLYLNDGKGKFRDVTSTNLPQYDDYTVQISAGDVDGDGDIDLFIGNGGAHAQANRLLLNNGRAVFTDVSKTWLDGRVDRTFGVAFVDFNKNGKLDVLEINGFDALTGSRSRVLFQRRGKMVGYTSAVPRIEDSWLSPLSLGDIDRDGDLDVFVGGRESGLMLVHSRSGLVDGTDFWLPSRQAVSGSSSFADLDGDKDLDLVIDSGGSEGYLQIFFNVDGPRFVNSGASVLPDSRVNMAPVAAGDLDGDGLVDLVAGAGRWVARAKRVYFQTAAGFVDHSSVLPPAKASTVAIELVDVDADGDLDIVCANRWGPHSLLENSGKGRFTDASRLLPALGAGATSLAVGDIDGDRDPDLVIGYEGRANRVLINTGGRLPFRDESSRIPARKDATNEIALVDVDGDGDLDLIDANGAYNAPARVRLHRNNGRGKFSDITTTNTPNVLSRFSAIAWGDFDGDRDVDLAFLARGRFSEVLIWTNDGKGKFSSSKRIQTYAFFSRIQAGDLDGDGDLDLLASFSALINDGRGAFKEYMTRARSTVLIDFDGDGDLDGIGADVVASNRWRNVFGTTLARLGLAYDIAIDAEAGWSALPPTRLAALWIGDRVLARPIPTPMGLFRLAPSRALFAGLIQVQGRALVRIRIPNLPALVGSEIASQALIFHGASPSTWKLTNVWADRIVH